MPSLINTQEREVVDRLESAPLFAVHSVRLQRLALELIMTVKFNGIGRGMVTKPIADPVSVTGPNKDRNAGLHDLG